MIKEKFELNLLTESSPDVLAWLVPGGRLFSWLCRSILIPMGWAALGRRRGQDALLVKPGGRLDDENTEDVLFIRSGPVDCIVDASDLRSADGYACSGTLEIGVRVLDEPAELAAFGRTIMGSSEVLRRSDLQRQLQWDMHRVLSELAAEHKAADLLGFVDSAEVRKLVDRRLGGACLAGGLSIDGPVFASFDSPAYREYCRQQASIESRNRHVAARTRIQQALAVAQKERLGHVAEIMKQLAEQAERHKDLSMADLLHTFSDAERAEMYSALWHLCPPSRRAWQVAAVSGQELLLFSPANLEKPARRMKMPEDLGPLRSVCSDEHSLDSGLVMVGARLGLHLVDLRAADVLDSLSAAELDTGIELRGGVNASAMSDDRVFATHSELGLLAWPRRMFNPPVEQLFPEITMGADTVRCARLAEGHLWFAADEEIWAWPQVGRTDAKPTLYSGSRERISALTVAAGMLYAGNSEGKLLAWEIGEPESVRVLRGATGNAVESIEVLDAGSVDHLIVADRGNALQAIVVEDNYVRRYESRSMPVRRAAVADDLFVAMNDNRDRLIAWDPRTPSEPSAVIIVPHITGSTIQDLCVIPQA